MNTRCISLSVLLFACLGFSSFAAGSSESDSAYLFTSFRGNGDGLHLAYSFDGRDWTDLNQVFLKPTVGSKLMRDPDILLGPDGLYHMVWTSGWGDKGIGYATSKNLQDWSEQRFIPLMKDVPGTETCWAPELFYDESNKSYIIMWSSSVRPIGSDHGELRAYYSVTRDFKTFSKPKILFDPGFNNLDTTMVKAGDKYVIVFKEADDQPKGIWGPIYVAVADKPLGPFKVLPDKAIENQRVEGPAVVTIDGKTLLYVDFYADGHYGLYETTDGTEWKDVTGTASVVEGQRHGSVFKVPQTLLADLRKEEKALVDSVPKPILDGFTADPSIRAFGNKYYIYPTSDRPNWNTTEFAVWSSPNLIDWKKEGVFLDLTKEIDWADIKAWAPDCIERDGKYYFYFCGDHNIGVAVSDSPTGPFKDALGHPLVENDKSETFSIDPHAFIDDDGQAYLYYGNGIPMVQKLNKDMISFAGPPMKIEGLREFREGIVTFKRNGKYYFMWSIDDARSPNYRVGWGIADSPLGPVKTPDKDFIVLQKHGNAVATAHHGLVNVPGTDRWYVAYHRHAVPGGSGYKRQVSLVRMEFDERGNIKPMDPLTVPFKPGDEGEPLVDGVGKP